MQHKMMKMVMLLRSQGDCNNCERLEAVSRDRGSISTLQTIWKHGDPPCYCQGALIEGSWGWWTPRMGSVSSPCLSRLPWWKQCLCWWLGTGEKRPIWESWCFWTSVCHSRSNLNYPNQWGQGVRRSRMIPVIPLSGKTHWWYQMMCEGLWELV